MKLGIGAAALAGGVMIVVASLAAAQSRQQLPSSSAPAASADSRQLVRFPEPMRLHTIANMREHLESLHAIDVALSKGDFDEAASVAESSLGMSSLESHGAAHLAPYMPKGMQDIGTRMHRAASRFAVEAQNAGVSNDVKPALAALGAVMEQCVACHATYRLH